MGYFAVLAESRDALAEPEPEPEPSKPSKSSTPSKSSKPSKPSRTAEPSDESSLPEAERGGPGGAGRSGGLVVKECHINIWALRGALPGRRLLYIDVGLNIRAGSRQVDSVQILLPFRVDEAAWPGGGRVAQDLYDVIANIEMAELVFGGPVKEHRIESDLTIKLDSGSFHVVRTDPTNIKQAEGWERRIDSSLYHVPLEEPIPPWGTRYFRTRWRVFGSLPIWQWKRLSGGARVDFRICDVRESRFITAERQLRRRIIPIEQANVFLTAPPSLQLCTQSPQFRNLRPVEPGAWKDYLRGTNYLAADRSLLAYYWKSDSVDSSQALVADVAARGGATRVDANDPFRIYLDFNKASSNAWWIRFVNTVAAACGAMYLYFHFGGAVAKIPWLFTINVRSALTFLGAGTVLGVVTLAGRIRLWASGRFLKPRTFARRVERAMLSITQYRV